MAYSTHFSVPRRDALEVMRTMRRWFINKGTSIEPRFEIDSAATFEQIVEWLGLADTVQHVTGKKGPELVGWCPWGKKHGNKRSFSINIEGGWGLCLSCKMSFYHTVDFMEKYIETHPNDPRFAGMNVTNQVAGVVWIISQLERELNRVKKVGVGPASVLKKLEGVADNWSQDDDVMSAQILEQSGVDIGKSIIHNDDQAGKRPS